MSRLLSTTEIESIPAVVNNNSENGIALTSIREPPASRVASRESNRHDVASTENIAEQETRSFKKGSAIMVALQMSLIYFICSVTNGLITISIPHMADELGLDQSLLYWPVLIYTLTSASFLLLAGSVADVLGSRRINLVGVLFVGIFTLACGLARNGPQLIAFRGAGGTALALFFPTSVSLISANMPTGKMRNIGFASIGVGQTLGYAFGLVIGGVLEDTIGWRSGYYIFGGLLLVLFVLGIWSIPSDHNTRHSEPVMKRLKTEIDWVGVFIASTALAILAYVLAQFASSSSNISKPYVIALMATSLALIPCCVFWFRRQERCNKPVLIPNSLWKRLPFTTVCIMITFAYAEMQTMELLVSLFFQQIQELPAIQASIRLLPSLVVGAILNFSVGILIHRLPVLWLVLTTSFVGAISPLLMAVANPAWPYWWDAFPAQVLFPLCIDVLFTVALLVVSEVFPEKDQAMAGAVFNTVALFGQSLGLAIIGVISNAVTQHESSKSHDMRNALLEGYRAGFWTAFGWLLFTCAVGAFGLRKVGKVGIKRD